MQVAADAPVVPTADPVVDPTAPRSLQQGMTEDEHEPTAGLQHPRDLLDGLLERVDVFEREAHHDRVERLVAARERVGARPRVPRATGAVAGHTDLRPRRIEPHDVDSAPREVPSDLALAAADVEHAAGTVEMTRDERQDLVDVLGVGTGGELALPPCGVLLPQRLVVATRHPHPPTSRPYARSRHCL
jgi:hypothetical protein